MISKNKRRKKRSNRVVKRTIISSNVNVKRVRTKDISTYFRINYKCYNGKLNKLSSCTVLNEEDVDGCSYIIFKKRNNGTWEMVITEDISEDFDEIRSISIIRDRYLKDV